MSSKEFYAQYGGTCKECGERFPPKTLVIFDDSDNLVTVNCDGVAGKAERDMALSAAEVQALRAQACPRCFCVHVGEC